MSDLDERFSAALHSTSRSWRQAVDRKLKYLGVSQASWMTIAIAAKARSPLSQSELADKLGVEGATMVAMIDRLVKAGLVMREASTTDRRVKRVIPGSPAQRAGVKNPTVAQLQQADDRYERAKRGGSRIRVWKAGGIYDALQRRKRVAGIPTPKMDIWTIGPPRKKNPEWLTGSEPHDVAGTESRSE